MAHARKFQPITRPAGIAPKQTGTAAAASVAIVPRLIPACSSRSRHCIYDNARHSRHRHYNTTRSIDSSLPACLSLSLSLYIYISLPRSPSQRNLPTPPSVAGSDSVRAYGDVHWTLTTLAELRRVWNSLPDDLRAQQDYESFRQGLKTWLFSRY